MNLQPFLQAAPGFSNQPGEGGFSMARANQRLTAVFNSAEASTVAETLNDTTNPRKSLYGSQVIDSSPLSTIEHHMAPYGREKLHATQKDCGDTLKMPDAVSNRPSNTFLMKPESAATTMNNTLRSNDLKLNFIRPKPTKGVAARIDSGLKNKKRQAQSKQANGITFGQFQVQDDGQSWRRDHGAMSNTASTRRKRPDWNDYFKQKTGRGGGQNNCGDRDLESFQYVGRGLDGRNDFQSVGMAMKKSEFNRMIEDQNRAKRTNNDTHISKVPLGSSQLREAAAGGQDVFDHNQRLFQAKIVPHCAPANVYNPQSWQDLISRTLDANELVKGGAIHPSRKRRENLKQTKQVLEPHLQAEVDVMGNKITGCTKRVLSSGVQTYQIGKKYKIPQQTGERSE